MLVFFVRVRLSGLDVIWLGGIRRMNALRDEHSMLVTIAEIAEERKSLPLGPLDFPTRRLSQDKDCSIESNRQTFL